MAVRVTYRIAGQLSEQGNGSRDEETSLLVSSRSDERRETYQISPLEDLDKVTVLRIPILASLLL